MARVLVCADGFFRAFSPVSLEPYIEMFINALVRSGNEVMPYITMDIVRAKRKIKSWYRTYHTYREVKDFNPDVIFSFNNALDERFVKKLDCPIYIVASDTPKFWHFKELILDYHDKYRVLYFNDDFKDDLKKEYKLKDEHLFLIPYTTGIKATDTIQDKDISFIGNFNLSTWCNLYINILGTRKNTKEKKELLKDAFNYYKEQNSLSDEIYKKYVKYSVGNILTKEQFESQICMSLTNYKRIKLLSALTDLDLNIFTWDDNFNCFEFNYKLFTKCHYEHIATAKDNARIYNESKIALSLPHMQVQTGFSWRVCDILASNSMLLTNPSRDLTELFGGIIPTYNDEKELRDKCIYYLSHDDERKEIVRKSHEIIDKNHRDKNLIEKLQECTGVKLENYGTKGSVKRTERTKELQKRYYQKQRESRKK